MEFFSFVQEPKNDVCRGWWCEAGVEGEMTVDTRGQGQPSVFLQVTVAWGDFR